MSEMDLESLESFFGKVYLLIVKAPDGESSINESLFC